MPGQTPTPAPVRLDDLRPGQPVHVDAGFPCMGAGVRMVRSDDAGRLFVHCASGHHYLDGQITHDGTLAGITLPEQVAS